jgi:hypothetical protein
MKNPESFLKEKPAGQAMAGGCKKMMKGEQGKCCGMKMEGCPMMIKGVDVKVENTKDGVLVTMTSKNPETVKMIQDQMAKMKECCAGAKKEETKKEPVKK